MRCPSFGRHTDEEHVSARTPPPPDDILWLKRLSFLDRFLALWILLAMALGILLGCFVPDTHDVLEAATFIGVSAPIGTRFFHDLILTLAAGLIVMMYPILCKVQYEELYLIFKTRRLWIQLAFSLVVNWIIAPLVMVPTRTQSFL